MFRLVLGNPSAKPDIETVQTDNKEHQDLTLSQQKTLFVQHVSEGTPITQTRAEVRDYKGLYLISEDLRSLRIARALIMNSKFQRMRLRSM